MYKKTLLKNGLTVVSHQMKDVFSVSLGIWLKVGARYEKVHESGISHLLEHVVFKGSKKYDNNFIRSEIEGRGGMLNGFTSEELTCYLAKVPAKNVYPVFKILLDMVLNPVLKEEDIRKEKEVITEEIRMYNDLPAHMAQELLDKLMWPGHPLGRSIAGTADSVNAISCEILSGFKEEYYSISNMVVVFSGNITHKDCLGFIDKALKVKKGLNKNYSFEKFVSSHDKPALKIKIKGIEQARLSMGFEAYNIFHPKRFTLSLLNVILGGNMSSRLFSQIREKKALAYEIGSSYKQLIDTGAFYINAGLENKKVELAISSILKELGKLKKDVVSSGELKRAKEFYLSQVAMSLEDTMDNMIYLGHCAAVLDKFVPFEQISREIMKITSSDIRETAREIFKKEKINVSLVGPEGGFKEKNCLELVNKV